VGDRVPEQGRIIAIDRAGNAGRQKLGIWVLFDTPAEVKKLVRDGAQLDADVVSLEFFNKQWVLRQ
jgi:hypothetical protein